METHSSTVFFFLLFQSLSHLWKLSNFLFLLTELRGLDLLTGFFTLRQIKAATSNFDPANKIGEGGFGPVYKVITNYFFFILKSDKLETLFEVDASYVRLKLYLVKWHNYVYHYPFIFGKFDHLQMV